MSLSYIYLLLRTIIYVKQSSYRTFKLLCNYTYTFKKGYKSLVGLQGGCDNYDPGILNSAQSQPSNASIRIFFKYWFTRYSILYFVFRIETDILILFIDVDKLLSVLVIY